MAYRSGWTNFIVEKSKKDSHFSPDTISFRNMSEIHFTVCGWKQKCFCVWQKKRQKNDVYYLLFTIQIFCEYNYAWHKKFFFEFWNIYKNNDTIATSVHKFMFMFSLVIIKLSKTVILDFDGVILDSNNIKEKAFSKL